MRFSIVKLNTDPILIFPNDCGFHRIDTVDNRDRLSGTYRTFEFGNKYVGVSASKPFWKKPLLNQRDIDGTGSRLLPHRWRSSFHSFLLEAWCHSSLWDDHRQSQTHSFSFYLLENILDTILLKLIQIRTIHS